MYNWSSPHTIVPLVLGVFGLLIFAIWCVYCPAEPILRSSMFASRQAISIYLGTTMTGCLLGAAGYLAVR
jgi:hypothetical protein